MKNSQKLIHQNNTINIYQNNNTINNNIFNININGQGNEDNSVINKDKLELLNEKDFYNSTFNDKANNHINNYLSILTDIINEPTNKNFRLINKKEKKFLIKNNNEGVEYKHLDCVNKHFYNLINDNYKDITADIKHYERFLKLIDIELNQFQLGNKSYETKKYYHFIKKLKFYIKNTILWSSEEEKVFNN